MIGLLAMMMAATVERVMLPDAVVPVHYDVHIVPDAKALTFTGDVAVDIDLRRATDRITLNAAELVIDRATLDGAGAPLRVDTDAAGQTITVHAAAPLRPGRHRLTLAWHGRISTFTSGFFALDYQGQGGPQRLVATKFEPAAARRFMPLWDEPGLKATYTVAADVPVGEMALSNMPAAATAPLPGGRKRVTFARSPKMSSYLLFFASGDFARVSRRVGATDVGVVVRKGAEDRARFALDAAAEILPYYNDYFGTPYALPKLDLIAGPGVGSFGAMENWGAIFFFESRLLVDADSTADDRQSVWAVVAHEIAHQWFGNLVTMAWWDDLWLNEGFASWMEGKAAARLHSEWLPALQALRDREPAMALDALASTHPVITDVRDGPSANQAFDAITYGKGQAVIGMLEAQVGADAFRSGVRAYMREKAYANAVNDELWSAVERASGQPVKAIAADFLGQPGLPLVRVSAAGRLTQARFTVTGDLPGRWTIPLKQVFLPSIKSSSSLLLTPAGTTVALPVIANAGQSTYARTAYDDAAFAPLLSGYPRLQPVDQLGLLLDGWALAQTPVAPAERPLALIAALPVDSPVWPDATAILSAIDRLHTPGPARDAFRRWATARLAAPFARVGWDARPGEPATDAGLRDALISLLGRWGDPAIVAEAARRTTGPLAKTATAIVAGAADSATFARLRAEARAATDPQDKADRYAALAAVRDPALAQQVLALATDGEAPPSLASSLVTAVAVEHPDLAWAHAVATHARLAPNLDLRQRYQYLPNVARRALSAARADELRAIALRDYPEGSRRFADQAETALRQRATVAETRLPQIDRWIAGQR